VGDLGTLTQNSKTEFKTKNNSKSVRFSHHNSVAFGRFKAWLTTIQASGGQQMTPNRVASIGIIG
jgi:hypothetical protein